MKVIYKAPGKAPYVKTLRDDNKDIDMHKGVEGMLDCVTIRSDVDVWCNDEGKLNGMEPNVAVTTDSGELLDVIHGPIIVCSYDAEGESISLPENKIDDLLKELNQQGIKAETADGKIINIPIMRCSYDEQ